ncbi:MAG: hypothetical protein LW688_07030 [Cryomorphaceae bacterium]|nr:hypothetical protein [Cryomorphaceae bacterium]
MLNYNDINKLFGKPLGNAPRPKTPFELKLWHVVVVGALGYFAYKGIVYSIQENSIRIRRKED